MLREMRFFLLYPVVVLRRVDTYIHRTHTHRAIYVRGSRIFNDCRQVDFLFYIMFGEMFISRHRNFNCFSRTKCICYVRAGKKLYAAWLLQLHKRGQGKIFSCYPGGY